jgi:2-polyprenyl-3-methyl-5-hydroxy-6-metoxy-1,4-benzoquinol methylase
MNAVIRAALSGCRHCGAPLERSFCDLGLSPLANSYLTPDQIAQGELFFPLHALVCTNCFLVQLREFETPDNIFSDYAYFSSFSDSWLEHARTYVERMVDRFGIAGQHRVIEIASNDGYLLQYFAARGVPVLGVEPAANIAKVAEERGIPSLVRFFGTDTARLLAAEERRGDLVIGNNVLAHVPDLNDFVKGLKIVLNPHGVITMEFPHLLRLMAEVQFDTIYHEHFSYFSFATVVRVFAAHGLRIFDVEQLPTHGGSLRIFATHTDDNTHALTDAVKALLDSEAAFGLGNVDTYSDFSARVQRFKRQLVRFLFDAKESGKTIAAYGAPAKGNTLLNYCGIGSDVIDYTVDRNPHKQGKFLPGSRIPILHPDVIHDTKPDYLFILPWNLEQEIRQQMASIKTWGGRFIVPVPDIRIVD